LTVFVFIYIIAHINPKTAKRHSVSFENDVHFV